VSAHVATPTGLETTRQQKCDKSTIQGGLSARTVAFSTLGRDISGAYNLVVEAEERHHAGSLSLKVQAVCKHLLLPSAAIPTHTEDEERRNGLDIKRLGNVGLLLGLDLQG